MTSVTCVTIPCERGRLSLTHQKIGKSMNAQKWAKDCSGLCHWCSCVSHLNCDKPANVVSIDFPKFESPLLGLRLYYYLTPSCKLRGHVVVRVASL